MSKFQMLLSKEVTLEDERVMRLDYSLVEGIMESEEKNPYFGVRITKFLDNLKESDEITGISTSRGDVETILKKLYQFDVTPISMVEIVDELVTQE